MNLMIAQSETSQMSPWWFAALIPISTVLGFAIQWLWNERKEWRKTQTQAAVDKEKTYVSQLEKLIERYEADRQDYLKESRFNEVECEKLKQQVSDFRAQMVQQSGDFRVTVERCVGHVRYLEGLLESMGKTDYRKFDPTVNGVKPTTTQQ